MRILFVVTNTGVVECLGPMYLSSLAKNAGHETRFVRLASRHVARIMKEWAPDVVAWSAFSGDFPLMASLNDELKSSFRFVSIFGGPHPTYFPAALFKHKIDYGVVGEGEEAFMELLRAVEHHDD